LAVRFAQHQNFASSVTSGAVLQHGCGGATAASQVFLDVRPPSFSSSSPSSSFFFSIERQRNRADARHSLTTVLLDPLFFSWSHIFEIFRDAYRLCAVSVPTMPVLRRVAMSLGPFNRSRERERRRIDNRQTDRLTDRHADRQI
jgi:hypothetical protein